MEKSIIKAIESRVNCKITKIEKIVEGHSSEEKYAINTDVNKMFVRIRSFYQK